jgi:hypothetical protein
MFIVLGFNVMLTLVRPATGHSDVPNPASLYDIMQCLHLRADVNLSDRLLPQTTKSSHRLLDRRVIVEAVALKQVDIVKLQPREGRLDTLEDVLEMTSAISGLSVVAKGSMAANLPAQAMLVYVAKLIGLGSASDETFTGSTCRGVVYLSFTKLDPIHSRPPGPGS